MLQRRPTFAGLKGGHYRHDSDRYGNDSIYAWRESLKTIDISAYISDIPLRPVGSGGVADIYSATYEKGGQRLKVAIKVMRERNYSSDNFGEKHVRREIAVMRQLSHKNVVGLLGIYMPEDTSLLPSIVTTWYGGGNIIAYFDRYRSQDVMQVKIRLLLDVVDAVMYLHGMNIVHGDIKPSNVLVTEDGSTAALTDFDCAISLTSVQADDHGAIGSLLYMAPEILKEDGALRSFHSDLWSFGLLIFEVVSNCSPYFNNPVPTEIISRILSQKFTDRADGIPDPLWELVTSCCAWEPPARSSTGDIREQLLLYQRSLHGVLPAEVVPSTSPSEDMESLEVVTEELPGPVRISVVPPTAKGSAQSLGVEEGCDASPAVPETAQPRPSDSAHPSNTNEAGVTGKENLTVPKVPRGVDQAPVSLSERPIQDEAMEKLNNLRKLLRKVVDESQWPDDITVDSWAKGVDQVVELAEKLHAHISPLSTAIRFAVNAQRLKGENDKCLVRVRITLLDIVEIAFCIIDIVNGNIEKGAPPSDLLDRLIARTGRLVTVSEKRCNRYTSGCGLGRWLNGAYWQKTFNQLAADAERTKDDLHFGLSLYAFGLGLNLKHNIFGQMVKMEKQLDKLNQNIEKSIAMTTNIHDWFVEHGMPIPDAVSVDP